MQNPARRVRKMKLALLGTMAGSTLMIGNCLSLDVDNDLFTVFREAYVPGLVSGLSTAVSNPDMQEEGLRQTVVAFIEGIGAVLQPEDSPTPIRSSSLDN